MRLQLDALHPISEAYNGEYAQAGLTVMAQESK